MIFNIDFDSQAISNTLYGLRSIKIEASTESRCNFLEGAILKVLTSLDKKIITNFIEGRSAMSPQVKYCIVHRLYDFNLIDV